MKTWGYMMLGLVVLAAGCATFDVRTDYDVSADFSRYKTYNFADMPTEPTAVIFSQLNQQRIREAISDAMNARGYTKVNEPDLLVHVNLVTKERQKLFTNYNYSYWGPRNDYVMNYTEGTLIIDMIDASTKQLVWRGSATGVLDENPSPENVTQNVNNAVAAILAQYPPK